MTAAPAALALIAGLAGAQAQPPPPLPASPLDVWLVRPVRVEPSKRLAALRALDEMPDAVRLAPGRTEVTGLAARGWTRYERGDLEGARHDLRAAAGDGAVPVWAHYALGLVEFALGRAAEAAAAFERVRAAEALFQPVYFDLVDAYLLLDRPDVAVAVLLDAGRRWPHDVEVWNALGVVETRRAALDRAIRAFETAAELDPADALAQFNLGRAYELRSHQSARWDSMGRRQWHAELDRRLAQEHYMRYLAIGGPYEQEARAALARLDWMR